MLAERYLYYVASVPEESSQWLPVTDKYGGEVATQVALADARTIERGIAAAFEAREAKCSRWT